ncbi:MAG: DUF4384 domain-containing protein [Longimicrobiales bacterium]
MNRWIHPVLAALALVPLFMGAGPAEQAVPTRWALVVGISDYIHLEDVAGGDLPGAERDARVMRDVLIQKWGFPTENVRVLLNRQATRSAIEEGLTGWLPSVVGPADHVTVFFAGHGSQMWDQNGDEDDGLDETIAPADVRTENTDFDISDDQFGEWLAGIPTDNVVVYLDSCNSGTGTREVTPFSRTRMLERDLSALERPANPARRAVGDAEDESGFDAGSGVVLELAAAQPHQAAVDAYFPAEAGGEAFHGGAFTTFLVRELWRAPTGTSYEEVFEGVRESLQQNRFEQDPYLSEDVTLKSRPVFSAEGAGDPATETALPVLTVEGSGAELGGGQSLGITTGSVFASTSGGARLLVETVAPERAVARVVEGSVEEGDRVRMVGYRLPRLPLRVNVGEVDSTTRDAVAAGVSELESVEVVDDADVFSHLLLRRRGDSIRVVGLDGAVRRTVPVGGSGSAGLVSHLEKEAASKQLGDIDNPSQDFQLDVAVADGRRTLGLGETVSFRARSGTDGYLTLVDLGTDGRVTVLYPNRYEPENRIAAGETYTFPSPEMGFEIQAQPPSGRGTVQAFLTTRPLDLASVTAGGDDFASGGVLLAEQISEAVVRAAGTVEGSRDAIRLDSWGTAFTSYEIEP